MTEENIRIITKLSNVLGKMTDFQKGKILGAVETLEEISEMEKREKEDSDENLQPAS